jgi:hypothetical protein
MTLAILLVASSALCLYAQDDTTLTVDYKRSFSGYDFIKYKIKVNDSLIAGEIKICLCDRELISYRAPYPGPAGIGAVSDINGDGKCEVLISSEASSPRYRNIFLYSLDTTAVLILSVDGDSSGLSNMIVFDLNDDGFLEFIFFDMSAATRVNEYGWNPSGYLVWQWDGSKYRIANYKLRDRLMKVMYNTDSISTFIAVQKILNEPDSIKSFNPRDKDKHLKSILSALGFLVYTNHMREANMLIDSAATTDIIAKRRFKQEIWEIIGKSLYWQDIQNSNW